MTIKKGNDVSGIAPEKGEGPVREKLSRREFAKTVGVVGRGVKDGTGDRCAP